MTVPEAYITLANRLADTARPIANRHFRRPLEVLERLGRKDAAEALGARYHVQTSLIYAIETAMLKRDGEPEELRVTFYGQ